MSVLYVMPVLYVMSVLCVMSVLYVMSVVRGPLGLVTAFLALSVGFSAGVPRDLQRS